MDESIEIVREFLVESHENLDQLDRDLVALEQDPHSRDLLSNIFRTIHTIKGSCGFLGFGKLERVTHTGESLLSKLRDGQLELQPDITTGLLSLVDVIRKMLDHIESVGSDGEAEYPDLVATLVRLQQVQNENVGLPPAPVAEKQPVGLFLGEPTDSQPVVRSGDRPQRAPIDSQPVDHGIELVSNSEIIQSSIRVDVGLLDKLMNQVGELVLARNQILQFAGSVSDSAFLSTSQRLNLITSELQEGVMKTRMQPIGNIWGKFPRLVRDLAVQCGKAIRIEMEGRETELDKTIVEAIKDPLTHLIRNSIDHGIESPDVRVAQGKPREGCLLLRAFHEGGQVNIEILDDGGGLNLERIRQTAIERGLLTRDQALRISDRDAALLIFSPGFSTAARITNVSGRGVGMDVVKTNVERIGGTVDIESRPGHGTTVRLKIPLTLAIIPALIITCGGDRYAIPQVSLVELVRLEGDEAGPGIERLHGVPVYRLRGQLLPIVDLRRELERNTDVTAGASQAQPQPPQATRNLVVLRANDRSFGLIVDSISDTAEIVVKPLSKQLKGIPIYAGATILGDGKVALILDVLGIARRARVISEIRDPTPTKHNLREPERQGDRQMLLILNLGNRRIALPIALVSRLEEIPESQVERADDREVVQYRGQILPLIRLGEVLGIATRPDPDRPLQVVVHNERGRGVGLVVDRVVDVVETSSDVQRRSQNDNLLISAVIQGRVTDLLNLPAVIRRIDPSYLELEQQLA